MKFLDLSKIFLIAIAGVLVASINCTPLNNKAAGWMSTAGEETRSYSHLGGGSKFAKGTYVSQPPRSSFPTANNTSKKTLAAILVMTVFGIGATALFVVLCSKITKKEQYDHVKGTIY